jgi:hypothetical protein
MRFFQDPDREAQQALCTGTHVLILGCRLFFSCSFKNGFSGCRRSDCRRLAHPYSHPVRISTHE